VEDNWPFFRLPDTPAYRELPNRPSSSLKRQGHECAAAAELVRLVLHAGLRGIVRDNWRSEGLARYAQTPSSTLHGSVLYRRAQENRRDSERRSHAGCRRELLGWMETRRSGRDRRSRRRLGKLSMSSVRFGWPAQGRRQGSRQIQQYRRCVDHMVKHVGYNKNSTLAHL